MGGRAQCVIGIRFDAQDVFEEYEEEVITDDGSWNGEIPKYHPETGEQLRRTELRRRLSEPFTGKEDVFDQHMWSDWRVEEEVDLEEVSSAVDAACDLGLHSEFTPRQDSDTILGIKVWEYRSFDYGGPEIMALSGDRISNTFEKVRETLNELGIDREPKMYHLTGWMD